MSAVEAELNDFLRIVSDFTKISNYYRIWTLFGA